MKKKNILFYKIVRDDLILFFRIVMIDPFFRAVKIESYD